MNACDYSSISHLFIDKQVFIITTFRYFPSTNWRSLLQYHESSVINLHLEHVARYSSVLYLHLAVPPSAGEMVQWWRALSAFSEDLSLLPSLHTKWLTTTHNSSCHPQASLDMCTQVMHINSHGHTKHIINKTDKSLKRKTIFNYRLGRSLSSY